VHTKEVCRRKTNQSHPTSLAYDSNDLSIQDTIWNRVVVVLKEIGRQADAKFELWFECAIELFWVEQVQESHNGNRKNIAHYDEGKRNEYYLSYLNFPLQWCLLRYGVFESTSR
jgi:hypothetical protein